MSKQLRVELTRKSTVSDQGAVVVLTGTCGGRKVTFVVDPGCAEDLAVEVEADGRAIAIVEPWQVR